MPRCLPTAYSERYKPVRMLIVPPTSSTRMVITKVPRMAFSRPPPVPVVSVKSTFHWKPGTALAMTPPASHIVGTTMTARQRVQKIRNTTLAIRLLAGTCGHSKVPSPPAAPAPGGDADAGGVLGVPLIVTAPADGKGGAGDPPDHQPGCHVG